MTTYERCARAYAKRRAGNDWKRMSHNQILLYDPREDCYMHKHHNTKTVFIYRDKYRVTTGGWDTVTTWKKIGEFCPIRTMRPRSKAIQHARLVYWGSAKKFVPYYDGIEIDAEGIPLEMAPCTFERIHRKEMDAFNEHVRTVREVLRTRMLVGEWDHAPTQSLPHTETVVRAFARLAEEGKTWIDHDLVMPLFMRRFADADFVPCTERFEEMVRYARQAPSLKETYTKECY